MRIATLVLALAAGCAAFPAFAQTRILTVQDQTQTPPVTAAPAATPVAPPASVQQPPKSSAESEAKREDRAPPPPSSRYRFNRVDNGFLRFDRESGAVAYCAPRTAGWSCENVTEDNVSLERQIAALRDEVNALRKEVGMLRPPPPPPHPSPPETVPSPPQHPDQTGSITIPLPSRADIARARGFITGTWRSLVDLIDQLQKDMIRKGGGAAGVSRT